MISTNPSLEASNSDVIVVDLDGTLTPVDTLHETAVNIFQKSPIRFLSLLTKLGSGKARFKSVVSDEQSIDGRQFPYNSELLEWLTEQKADGAELCLATGADRKIADAVATHLDIFDGVLASDGSCNLTGPKKRDAILSELGDREFWYAGNSQADIPVWQEAAGCVVVTSDRTVLREAEKSGEIKAHFTSPAVLPELLKAIRPQQWLKNVLLYVPLIVGHHLGDAAAFLSVTIAFVALCLLASATYLLNDCIDRESDRLHPTKKKRPIAAGTLSIQHALIAALIGIATSIGIAALNGRATVICLAIYTLFTLAYSFGLKKKLLIDIFMLAGLFLLRVVCGGAVAGIVISPWLMAFSAFFFLSLALAKRYTELVRTNSAVPNSARAYRFEDTPLLGLFGVAAGFSSVIVLSLYLSSEDVRRIYSAPEVLWAWIPAVLYWLLRIWMFAYRRTLAHDPVRFAATDSVTYLLALTMLVTLVVAQNLPVTEITMLLW